ncbi:MAG: YedE-related selenium metabolism membrane protein [Candidatus Eisenbacteria bacterium]|nr:YedE-related selenium metabolism membrane protein [Candidatus Eisenbacteria bacterium]
MSRWKRWFGSRAGIVVVGAAIGLLAACLQKLGNPPNMGVCVACFQRDIAGALGLHRAAPVQYLRPEIPGLLLGAMLSALAFAEFRPRAGSAPVVRFLLGAFAMIGALAFLGCPWRAVLRLAGGDLSALLGIAGLIGGIALGIGFQRRGFSLGRAHLAPALAGWIMPAFMLGLVLFALLRPSFVLASATGPGSMHAPVAVALLFGLVMGTLIQRTRFCTIGAFRNVFVARDTRLLSGLVAMLVAAWALNMLFAQVHVGLRGQPIAHSSFLWAFLGMGLAGLAFTLGGGCPGRQLCLSGEGDGDASVFVLGMISGAAFAHNFLLAAVPDQVTAGALQVGGPGPAGRAAVVIGLIVTAALGLGMREPAVSKEAMADVRTVAAAVDQERRG